MREGISLGPNDGTSDGWVDGTLEGDIDGAPDGGSLTTEYITLPWKRKPLSPDEKSVFV
jgi:hypothetical protein